MRGNAGWRRLGKTFGYLRLARIFHEYATIHSVAGMIIVIVVFMKYPG